MKATESIQLVSATGEIRNFSRIADALDCAGSTDTLKISPGDYLLEAPLVVTQHNLAIQASRANLHPPAHAQTSSPLLTVQAAGVTISGLQIVGSAEKRNGPGTGVLDVCIAIYEGDVHLESCCITGWHGSGILIAGSSSPHISNCRLHDCFAPAMVLIGHANPTVVNCTFEHNQSYDIVCKDEVRGSFLTNKHLFCCRNSILGMDRSTTLFKDNYIASSMQSAFLVQGHSTCVIQENTIEGCGQHQIQVIQNANPKVLSNTISRGHAGGILVQDHACGSFVSNTIHANQACGILTMGQTQSICLNNIVTNNRLGGFFISDKSEPTLDSNIIRSNGHHGVVEGAAKPCLQLNNIEGNVKGGVCLAGRSSSSVCHNVISVGAAHVKQPLGVLVRDQALATLRENKIHENVSCNVVFRDDSCGDLEKNEIWGCQSGGVMLQSRAQVMMASNKVRDNGLCNLGIMEHALIDCKKNVIQDSQDFGILLLGHSRGVMRYNIIAGNKKGGVHCSGRSEACIVNNRVCHNRENGILLCEKVRVLLESNLIHGNLEAGLVVKRKCHVDVLSNVVETVSVPKSLAVKMSSLAHGRVAGNIFQVGRGSNILPDSVDVQANAFVLPKNSPNLVEKAEFLCEESSCTYLLIEGPSSTTLAIRDRWRPSFVDPDAFWSNAMSGIGNPRSLSGLCDRFHVPKNRDDMEDGRAAMIVRSGLAGGLKTSGQICRTRSNVGQPADKFDHVHHGE
eukprot:750088-Hanusia_phi.AAC.3